MLRVCERREERSDERNEQRDSITRLLESPSPEMTGSAGRIS
jgi:hypothetical protein